MNFKLKRINARKIVFVYFYQIIFNSFIVNEIQYLLSNIYADTQEHKNLKFLNAEGNLLSEEELEIVKDLYKKLELKQKELEINIEYIKYNLPLPGVDIEENISYIINNFFDNFKRKDLIDYDYVFSVGKSGYKYFGELNNLVNTYLETFKFEELDFVDRAIFLLGYTEYKVLDTPPKIIQNEMVEIAKRYGDEGSPKLVNAVFYKIFG